MNDFSLETPSDFIGRVDGVLAALTDVRGKVAEEEQRAIGLLEHCLGAFRSLCVWAVARRSGEADSQRHLDAAKERAVLIETVSPDVRFTALREAAAKVATAVHSVNDTRALTEIASLLSRMPCPPFIVASPAPFGDLPGTDTVSVVPVSSGEPLVVRVMLVVDGKPWANPQALRTETIYDLALTAAVSAWPDESDHLVLDAVTTMVPEHYRISKFRIERPRDPMSVQDYRQTGHVEFPVGQSVLSGPALLQIRATFLSSSAPMYSRGATVIGYHKLRTRISDPSRVPMLSKYRALDTRLLDIVEQVRDLPGIQEGHLDDFVAAMAAILNYMGISIQQALYKARSEIDEDDFQENLLLHLRGQLGEEVLEAPHQGGGITDIRYRSVTIELKVEKEIKNRATMVRHYQNQPTQYSSATSAQLGILCVLDLTTKTEPPAPPQNNVILLTPQLHGFPAGEAPFPVRIAAVVIDGNLKKPSDYSR